MKNFFNKRTISSIIVVVIGIIVYILLSNFGAVRSALGFFFGVFMPFAYAVGIAFLLDIPTRFFAKRLFGNLKHKRGISILVSYALAVFVIAFLIGMILPQVWESIINLLRNIPDYLNNLSSVAKWITDTFMLEEDAMDFLVVNYSDLITQVSSFLEQELPNILDYTKQIGSGLLSAVTAIIASIYMLLGKDKLLSQLKKTVYAIFSKRWGDIIYRVGHIANRVFSGFISGKLIDSAIIGVICFVFMFVTNQFFIPMPYALLISVIVGITNIIPFFGPFIGAIPSVMILLLVNPWSAVVFTIFIIVLQQFDGNILGPKILGDSTGLPALWVLIAIIVFGGLFGFIGMLLGVPTVAVLYTVFSDIIAWQLHKKHLNDKGEIIPEEEMGEDETGVDALRQRVKIPFDFNASVLNVDPQNKRPSPEKEEPKEKVSKNKNDDG